MLDSKAAASGSTTAVVASTMAANIAMSSSLQLLWGLVNVMQLLLVMPLLNVKFPINVATFYSFIISIASFDLLPTPTINDKIFEFTNGKREIKVNFQESGYETGNIIKNLGSMAYYIVFYIILVFITVIIGILKGHI